MLNQGKPDDARKQIAYLRLHGDMMVFAKQLDALEKLAAKPIRRSLR